MYNLCRNAFEDDCSGSTKIILVTITSPYGDDASSYYAVLAE